MKNTLFTTAIILLGITVSPVSARVYNGTPHIFAQPNGDSVSVRLFGTELYMDAESEDGYTLIRDEENGYICYAMLSADAMEYASTGIKFNGGTAPSELNLVVKPHIRLDSERRNEIIADNKSKLGQDKQSTPKLRAATTLPDTVYGVTIMIDFPDRKFTISRDDVEAYLNSSDRTVYGNARSIKEHFRWMSGGKLTYINLLPKEIYHAPYGFDYYSPADATEYTTDRFFPVVTEALLAITKEKDGFDLNDISFDGPKMMAINIFYAGEAPSKWATGLWPHMGGYNFDLRRKYNISTREWHSYQMCNLGNDLSMGTFVHENGHLVLGLPDYYSYEESNTDNNIKDFNIANTFWTPDEKNPELLNPFAMDELGWLTEKQDITNVRDGSVITIKQEVGNAAVFYGAGANSNERYYFEVRDKHYENYYGKKNQGVMIWHVNTNGDNNYAGKPELLDGRPATSKDCMWNAYTGPGVFSDDSEPSAKWYNGNNSDIYLWDFSVPGSTMTFRCGNEIAPIEIVTVGEYSFDVMVDVNDGYSATVVDINIPELSDLLGIAPSEFVSKIGSEVSLYAVESDGEVVKSFTANNGYWYNLNGDVDTWTTNTTTAAVFAEIDPYGNGMRIGQYPGNTKDGDSCSVKQVVIYGEKQVYLTYNIKVVDKTNVEYTLASSTKDCNIRVYNENGQFIGDFRSIFDIENKEIPHGVYILEQSGMVWKIIK